VIRLAYRLLTCSAAVLAYPVGVLLAVLGRPALLDRLRPPADIPLGGPVRVWIHAASVGEAGIAAAMAEKIKKEYPGALTFVSTMTVTGLARIRCLNEQSGGFLVDRVFLAPLDCPLVARAFVNRVSPTICMLVETELWPSLIEALDRSGIPVVMINGKLTRRSFRRYMAVKTFMESTVRRIALCCVQSRPYARRFSMMGVPADTIEITGNIKFDSLPDPAVYDRRTILGEFGLPPGARVFTAGSTRPGEEEIIIQAFKTILGHHPGAVMIIAPRHLKRVREVGRILSEYGLEYVLRTSGEQLESTGRPVLLLDTMGELITAFACSEAAFVGGSLGEYGGHNPMEPAALGIPVLFGPYMEQTGAKELLDGDAAALVHDETELALMISRLLTDDSERLKMGRAGLAVVGRFRGGLDRTLRCMRERGIMG